MSQTFTSTHSRFRGAILGMAVGDALAFPGKGRSRRYLTSQVSWIEGGYRRHDSGFYPAGQYTDDTQGALALVGAITEARGTDPTTVAEYLVPLWRDGTVVDARPESSEVLPRLLQYVEPAPDDEAWTWLDAAPLCRAVPVGLWLHTSPLDIVPATGGLAGLTHPDIRVQAAAASIAAAVSYTVDATDILLGSFLDRMAATAGRFYGPLADLVLDLPRVLSLTEYRALEIFAEFVESSGDTAPRDFWEGTPDRALFQALAAVYYFLKSPFDFEQSVGLALRAGGEITTLCALTGALSGSFLGEPALPEPLVGNLLDIQWIEERIDAFHATWAATSQDGPGEGGHDTDGIASESSH